MNASQGSGCLGVRFDDVDTLEGDHDRLRGRREHSVDGQGYLGWRLHRRMPVPVALWVPSVAVTITVWSVLW